MNRGRILLLAGGCLLATSGACKLKKAQPADEPPMPSVPSAVPDKVPPVAVSGVPVSAFADASDVDGKTPLEQASLYEASGQLWMARLVLEKRALGPTGTKDEAELLARVCAEQGDEPCVADASRKLGRKYKLDGGARRGADSGRDRDHKEPDTDAARARDLVLKGQYDAARRVLEPKVLDGKASKEEIRLLRTACDKQGDRMCVALCDAKLK